MPSPKGILWNIATVFLQWSSGICKNVALIELNDIK